MMHKSGRTDTQTPGASNQERYLRDYIEQVKAGLLPSVHEVCGKVEDWESKYKQVCHENNKLRKENDRLAGRTFFPTAASKKMLTFEEWEKKSQVYYHIAPRDGDWSMEKALKECWKAAQENM